MAAASGIMLITATGAILLLRSITSVWPTSTAGIPRLAMIVPSFGYIITFALELDLEKSTAVLRMLICRSPG
jgi:hypothetical protein